MLRVGLVQTRTPATQARALEQAAPLVRQAAAEGCARVLKRAGAARVDVAVIARVKHPPTQPI